MHFSQLYDESAELSQQRTLFTLIAGLTFESKAFMKAKISRQCQLLMADIEKEF